MAKFKVGIIGCGGIANQKHLPALKHNKNVEIVAFCDIIRERAEKSASEYGIENAKVFTDYKELLKEENIDVVHVLTPNKSHSFISIDAMNAGKHVMCEKPMAKTYQEAKAMLDTSLNTGKILSIGYQNRCNPTSLYAKKMAENDELGEIYYAKAHALRRRAVPTWGVFLNEEEQGGGPLIDIGTHALDLTLWTMNNYKPKMVVGSVYKKLSEQKEQGNAFGEWNPSEFTVEDSAFGFITMENGATIVLESSWALNTLDVREAMTTLCGTKGGIDMGQGGTALRFNTVKHNTQVVETPDLNVGGVAFFEGGKTEPHDLENQNFYQAVAHNDKNLLRVKPEEAVVVTQILEAIYESARTGKPVFFND